MEHVDKLIPIAVLLAVAGFLVVLLRAALRDGSPARAVANTEVIDAPSPGFGVPHPGALVEIIKPVETPVAKIVTPKKRKPVVKAEPINAVVAMLRDKDALVKAFLLREILDPPVSRLRRSNREAPRER